MRLHPLIAAQGTEAVIDGHGHTAGIFAAAGHGKPDGGLAQLSLLGGDGEVLQLHRVLTVGQAPQGQTDIAFEQRGLSGEALLIHILPGTDQHVIAVRQDLQAQQVEFNVSHDTFKNLGHFHGRSSFSFLPLRSEGVQFLF